MVKHGKMQAATYLVVDENLEMKRSVVERSPSMSIIRLPFPLRFCHKGNAEHISTMIKRRTREQTFHFFQSRPILPKLANHSEKKSLLEAEVIYFIFSIIMACGTFSQMLRDFVLSVNV